ncbi:MAG: hypothetical protein ACM3YN_14275 [Parcubacteria group bacterium]
MTTVQIASLMMLASGALHAGVNAILKSGQDKMSSRALMTDGLALYAYRMGDVPRLAALRETSILFATAIAVFVLKERLTPGRVAGIAGIATGAAVLIASS